MERNNHTPTASPAPRRTSSPPARRYRILRIINQSTVGGGQRNVYWLTRELRHHPQFITHIACAPGGDMWPRFQEVAAMVHPLRLRLLGGPVSFLRLCRILQREKIDIVHTHGGVAGLWGRLAAVCAGVPVIVHTLHGIHYLNYRNPITRWSGILLERLLSRSTTATIYVSPSNYRDGRRYRLSPPAQSIHIRNVVDVPDWEKVGAVPREELLGVPPSVAISAVIFACVARFDPVKSHDTLLEAFQVVARRHPHAYLVLVGDGPLETQMREKARQLDLANRIRFLGSRSDVYAILRSIDVQVLPSLWEGLPLTILEGMAAGRPIIASNVPGIADVVSDGQTALLVPPQDADQLAAAMERAISDPLLREKLGRNAEREFLAQNDMPRMVEQVSRIYLNGLLAAQIPVESHAQHRA